MSDEPIGRQFFSTPIQLSLPDALARLDGWVGEVVHVQVNLDAIPMAVINGVLGKITTDVPDDQNRYALQPVNDFTFEATPGGSPNSFAIHPNWFVKAEIAEVHDPDPHPEPGTMEAKLHMEFELTGAYVTVRLMAKR